MFFLSNSKEILSHVVHPQIIPLTPDLQDSAAIASPPPSVGRSSSRLGRASPSDAHRSFDSPSEPDVRWEEWAPGSGAAPRGPLSAVSERRSEDTAFTHSLTADGLALQVC